MRLWSISPKYLDQKGLVAAWREALLAKAVLEGKTKGYKNHPQLVRFKRAENPVGAINSYLWTLLIEAGDRGYKFNANKAEVVYATLGLNTTTGQIQYEFQHLNNKLFMRDVKQYELNNEMDNPIANDIFNIVDGPIEEWEKI